MDLTLAEAREAFLIGLARHDAARARGGRHRYGDVPREVDGYSAVGEAEVAKILGRRWISDGLVPDDPKAGDVEGGIQVRWTRRLAGGLIAHDYDRAPFCALAVGLPPDLRAVGWIATHQATVERFWRSDIPEPAYIVPQSELRPFSHLADEPEL